MIMGLDMHPQLTRQNRGAAAAAQNHADNNENDSSDEDDYDYVLDVSDEE